MFEFILIGVGLALLALVYVALSRDESDRIMERMDEEARHRQRLRLARMGDAESRIKEFAETGKLPPLEKQDTPKRKAGRPRKVS